MNQPPQTSDGNHTCRPPTDQRPRIHDVANIGQSTQNPQSYATRIKEHADRATNIDIHSGLNYRALAVFLNKPYTDQIDRHQVEAASSYGPPLVCVHSLDEEGKPATKLYRSALDRDVFSANPPLLASNSAHITWVSGYPAPEWINVIGAQYRVDPEFFRRHLNFLQSKDNHDVAAMPSFTQRMLTIRLTTVCRRPIALSRRAIEQARVDAAGLVRLHQQKLQTGDSIVRTYSVFDHTTFTIEQEITVYVERSKQHNGWIAVICSDIGKDLTSGPAGPWHSDRLGMVNSCEPVIMYVPKLALERPPRPQASSTPGLNNAGQMCQNASLLAENLGLPPASQALRLDVRDTLHDVFAFAAAAESQFLATMQDLVDRELQLQSSEKKTEWTLSNLRYFKSALDDHIVSLEITLAFLRRPDVPRWTPRSQTPRPTRGDSPGHSHLQPPTSPPGHSGEPPQSRLASLGDDYWHLLQRATKLSNRCVENTTILMNMAMLEESKKAIIQADGLRRLTLLTFFFLPLSLTTSFFGMNFHEFGTGKLSIWACFVLAVPFLSFSIVLCFWESVKQWFQERLGRSRQEHDLKAV